jgi:hypothetical protein
MKTMIGKVSTRPFEPDTNYQNKQRLFPANAEAEETNNASKASNIQ